MPRTRPEPRRARIALLALAMSSAGLTTGACENMGLPFGLAQRGTPSVTIPIDGQTPGQGTPTLTPAFPAISPFDEPIDFVAVPGTQLSIVIEQDGRLQIFDTTPGVTSKSLFLDITDRVSRAGFIDERGLLGCAFDPGYPTNGFFYCYYTRTGDNAGVLSRFQRSATNPRQAIASSEIPLLVVPQPEANHNGGDLAFGPNDGFLYLSLGDGGGANDNHGPTGNAQRLDQLLGSILRIDPETDANGGYQIPPGNPFGGQKCSSGSSTNGQPCGEIFHFGLRNPWRFSFDSMTGDGWIGDVGQGAQEEVDFWADGEAGINFGWACREGTIAGPKPTVTTCDSPSERRDPVTTFPTRQNPSVIGGYVYRGFDVGQLQGLYVYAGFNPGTIMTTDRAGNANQLSISTSGRIHGMGEDATGELYVVYGNGAIDRFSTQGGGGGQQIPTLLSATGIFADTRAVPLQGAPGVNPYDVRARLFSDNLDKTRFLAIPTGTTIGFTPTGRWSFPPGSVIAKNFLLGSERIETRVLVRGSDRWRGYTYQWNAAQTDATLVPAQGATIQLSSGELYDLPSRLDCIRCHNDRDNAESQIIGLQTRQLNFDMTYPNGVVDNQLRTLNSVGYFDRDIGTTNRYETFPDYADPLAGSINRRARAYLEQNCGFCHRDGGGTPVGLRLEFDEPLDSLIGVIPDSGPVAGAQLIVDPGSKENSVLWQRMQFVVDDLVNRGPSMPPLAHRQVDAVGVALIGEWIDNGLPDPVATGVFTEGGGSEATGDSFTLTNDGTSNLLSLTLDLSNSERGVFFDTADVPFQATTNQVGFDGTFSSPNPSSLTLRFTSFAPGRSFSVRLDLDDRNGPLVTGSDLAGARLTVVTDATGPRTFRGTVRAVAGSANEARVSVLAD